MPNEAYAKAEFNRLESVRVHRPGFETFLGVIDPQPNLFLNNFSVRQAKEEHDEIVSALEDAGVDVHYLHDDLSNDATIDRLLREKVDSDLSDIDRKRREVGFDDAELINRLEELDPYSKLQVISCNTNIIRRGHDAQRSEIEIKNGFGEERLDSTIYEFREPMSNLYFQRDQQLITDKGPVLGNFGYSTRQAEVDLARAAWEAIGADIVHSVTGDATLEGGDYIPAGKFGLVGVSGVVDGEEEVLRTSLEAGEELVQNQVFNHDEVGLVRAPLEAEREILMQRKPDMDTEPQMDIMHLDTWFNIVDDGLAVGRKYLIDNTDIIVYTRNRDGNYSRSCTREFGEYLREKGYEIIPVPYNERRFATNFLTIDQAKVFPICITGRDGYESEKNQTIERIKDYGVDIIPNGTGIDIDALRSGYGGIHCMTTPIQRR